MTTLEKIPGLKGPAIKVLIYLLIARQEGRRVTYKQIGNAIGWGKSGYSNVAHLMCKLEDAGLVKREKNGKCSVMPTCCMILRKESMLEEQEHS